MVIDLDPAETTELGELRDLAHRLREQFDQLGLIPMVQATGGRGFHVTVPLDGRIEYAEVRELAAGIAEHVAAENPDRLTTKQRKDARGDRTFLDINRNAYGQTTVAPYSLRARPHAPVATPLDWAELGSAKPNAHTIRGVRRRLSQKDDPWAGIAAHAGSATAARRRFHRLGRVL